MSDRRDLLHGRPPDVRPLQVVAASLESERPIMDSGVLAKTGIAGAVSLSTRWCSGLPLCSEVVKSSEAGGCLC